MITIIMNIISRYRPDTIVEFGEPNITFQNTDTKTMITSTSIV